VPGYKRSPEGHVSTARIAGRLGVDRRVLKELHELGELAGVRAGGVIWLERQALAAYLWSRPRCVRDDCGRRVIGEGPGCSRHRRSGRHHSDGTKRKMSETQREGPPVERTCGQCGKQFEVSAALARSRPARFCSAKCTTDWLNDRAGANDRLQEGHLQYRDDVERVKSERGLIDMDGVCKRLRRAGVPRSRGAISGHIRKGLLERERALGFDKPYLFTEAAVDEYIGRIRNYRDGRLRRFDEKPAPGEKSFRGKWHDAHGYGTAGYGMLNGEKGSRGGRPRGSYKSSTDERAYVRQLKVDGLSQRKIADRTGLSRAQVRLALSRLGG
jgi:hypothetical protein